MRDERFDETSEAALLQSVVAVARSVYGAAASSIFLVDEETGELVFTAVSGAGEERLVGARFAPGTGIAGWVADSGQSLIVDDVATSEQFAREAAEFTGHVPRSIMAAPLIHGGECIGVLEVIDRYAASAPGRELDDMELLGLLATQAAIALSAFRRRQARMDGRLWRADLRNLLNRLERHLVSGSPDPALLRLLAAATELVERSPALPPQRGGVS